MAVTGPFAVGVKMKPTVQVEPAMMVVPHVVVLLSMVKCESEVVKGAVRLRLSVPKLLRLCFMAGELWPTMTVPKARVGVRVGDLANRAVAVVDDEEIAAAVDSDADVGC